MSETSDSYTVERSAMASNGRLKATLEKLIEAVCKDTHQTDADIQRANALISEATGQLVKSFDELTSATKVQSKQHDMLMARLSANTDEDNDRRGLDIQEFLGRIGEAVRKFGDLVGVYAIETMRINDLVGEVLDDITAMRRVVGQIDEIADDTGILAINAALEAARAGEAGQGFKVVSSEIRGLAKKTKILDREIYERVHGTNETSEQAREALRRLAGHDLTPLVVAKDQIAEMTDRLESLECDINSTLDGSRIFASSVHASMSDAMRALQFEDIVTQVTTTAARRQAQLPDRLRQNISSLPANATVEDLCTALLAAIDGDEEHMPANQETMDEGEFTLF